MFEHDQNYKPMHLTITSFAMGLYHTMYSSKTTLYFIFFIFLKTQINHHIKIGVRERFNHPIPRKIVVNKAIDNQEN